MRVTDIFMAFPRLVLALAFVAALGPGIENAVLAIAVTAWPPYARIARAETIALPARRIHRGGEAPGRLAWRASCCGHIVPLCLSSVIVRLTLDMAGVILTAAGLGFLGLGAQPPTPEWGAMVAVGAASTSSTNGGSRPCRASRSRSSASASTCSATDCATCSTRNADERSAAS